MQRSSKEEYFKRVARSANAPSIVVGKDAARRAKAEDALDADSEAQASSQMRNEVLEQSYSFLAKLIVKTLNEPGITSIFGLLTPLDLSTEQLLPIIRRMENEGLVTVKERDRTGNWKIEPTDKGQALLR